MAEIKTEKELREKIMNEKCSTCRYNTVGQDEYITTLEEQNKELEKQIEKMKCCCLCVHCGKDCDSSGCGNPCDRWEFGN